MIYIHKDQIPSQLLNYSKIQLENHLMPIYEGEWKVEFRDRVVEEQSKLCCYCMNSITSSNSKIEHFLPESIFKEEVANYFNLFLVCNSSTGRPERLQHCDTSPNAKSDKLIPKYILHPECELFFAYNSSGEILPYHNQYKTIANFYANYDKIDDIQKMIVATIDALKLNVSTLTEQRKNVYSVSVTEINKMTENDLVIELRDYYAQKNSHNSKKFCGVYFYLIREQLRSRNKISDFNQVINNWKNSLSRNSNSVVTIKV